MKTAIYIEDGITQLVITPETKFETESLSAFENHPLETEIFSGSFYDCRGGWTRQSSFDGIGIDVKSLIIKIATKKKEE